MAKHKRADVVPIEKARPARSDGWTNILTGLGTTRDKRTAGKLTREILAVEDALELYRGDSLAKRIVKLMPDEMLREWFDLQISSKEPEKEDDTQRTDFTDGKTAGPAGTGGEKAVNPLPEDSNFRAVKEENVSKSAASAKQAEELIQMAEDVQDYLEDLKFAERLHEAMYYSRASGGGGILMGVDDGSKDLAKPLNMANIRAVKYFSSFHARELQADTWIENPLDPDFGLPDIYRIVPQSASYVTSGDTVFPRVHRSRLIIFQGDVATRRQLREGWGWGDPVFTAIWEVLRDFNTSWGSAAHLIQDFSMGVFTMKGLGKIIAGDRQNELAGRLAAIQMSMSAVRAAVIDENEKYERQTTPMGGLPETLELFMLRMAAAAEMPVSLLFGQAPAGLQATGDSDIRYWYAAVAAKQKRFLRPQIEQALKVVFNCKTGPTKGIEPEGWHVHFAPLWRMTEKEEAEIRKLTSEADAIDIGDQVLIPEEVTMSRYGDKEYSTETKLDMELRKAIAEEPPPPEPDPTFVDRTTGKPVPIDPITKKPAKPPPAKDKK